MTREERLEMAVCAYRTALIVYADPRNYMKGLSGNSVVEVDGGQIARSTLEGQGMDLGGAGCAEQSCTVGSQQREGFER